MQVQLYKVKVTDTDSEFDGQLVDIVITDGIITDIHKTTKAGEKKPFSLKSGDETLELNEEVSISPGWVDIFADYREPGYEHKETLETGMAAAAAGGYTDVLVLPGTDPVTSTKSAVQYIINRSTGNIVNLHPTGAATQKAEGKEMAEMLDMYTNGAIAFTDGWKPIQNAGLMLKVLEYVKSFDGTILQMPVDTALSAGGLMNEGIISTSLGMPGIPVLAETLMIYRDIELLRYTGSKLHITGVSTAEGIDMIRNAKAEGLSLTCSVTPYHLALTEDALTTYHSAYKVTPPLRGEADRQALITAINDGTIDCIATHHRPHEWDAKTKEFEYAADGMAIQELCLNILCTALPNKTRLAALLAHNPRKIFGLPACTITKGSNAAFTLYTTEGTTTLPADKRKSMGMNNPFLGKELAGRVTGICNNGKLNLNKQ